MKRLVLIDGTNLFNINYAANPSRDLSGNPIGGVKGCLGAVGKLAKNMSGTRVVVIFDGKGGGTQKRRMYKEYKSGRKPSLTAGRVYKFANSEEASQNKKWQLLTLIEILQMLPLNVIISKDCEADDIIGYTCRHLEYFGFTESIIVSTDKDFYQLISDKVKIYNPISKKHISEKEIEDEYNIQSKNWLVAKAIVGDNSDNIGGIEKIGFKTVAKLLNLSENDIVFDDQNLKNFLEENLKDLKKGSKSQRKNYQKILDNFEIVKRNFKLMDLKEIMMPEAEKDRITKILENFSPTFKKKDLYIKFMRLNLGYDMSFLNNFNGLYITK